jgi:hypothetical protein
MNNNTLIKIHVLHCAPMQHHFNLTMQNSAPFGTIPSHLVHGEPFGSLVQNNQFGFFLICQLHPLQVSSNSLFNHYHLACLLPPGLAYHHHHLAFSEASDSDSDASISKMW